MELLLPAVELELRCVLLTKVVMAVPLISINRERFSEDQLAVSLLLYRRPLPIVQPVSPVSSSPDTRARDALLDEIPSFTLIQ